MALASNYGGISSLIEEIGYSFLNKVFWGSKGVSGVHLTHLKRTNLATRRDYYISKKKVYLVASPLTRRDLLHLQYQELRPTDAASKPKEEARRVRGERV